MVLADKPGASFPNKAVNALEKSIPPDGGVAKRRQQRIYSDILGRTFKTEVLNWEGGSEYSTTVTTYNVRDQVTQIRQYAGPESSGTYQDTTMTYDGFGRLKTSHAPEQQPEPNNSASSDHTTFFYNADDTISYLIDARGVVKTLTYNHRHMVTAISHDLANIPPAYNHVAPTANITFTYDAVGNRLSMTDGSGSTSYGYNNLGQLSSETRQFGGPLSSSSYTLNYQYNLGGQLKKITDHTNTTVNYNYTRAGQLSAVTGENNLVEGVATYATGFAYRAWGALSSVNFGNGTTQQTNFNSRLLPTSSSIGNVVEGTNQNATMSWNYDYYADARQRHAFDGSDDRFDRMFEFDHTGQLKGAYSGREARGLAASNPADSPYRQSFEYNAFGDRIQKSGRFWRTEQTGATPCTPRQTNDGCDAEGNVLNHNGGVHTYDAAGQQVNFVNWRQPVGGTPNHPDVLPGLEIVQNYNGDGRSARRIETRRSEEPINGGPNTNITETVTTNYYIYSSVLGGARVVELDASGNKVSGYVYANGTRLAKQDIQPTPSTVTWHHPNPGTNSWVETGSERVAWREEMDPDGAEVGTEDPWASILVEGTPTYEKLKEEEPLYIEGGDPFDYSGGHTIDGLPVSAAEFARRVGDGTRAVGVQYHTGNGVWQWPTGSAYIFSGNGGYSVLVTEESSHTTGIVAGIDLQTGQPIDTIIGSTNLWSKWTFVPFGFRGVFLLGSLAQLQDTGYPPPRPWTHDIDDCHYLARTVDQYASRAKTTTGFINALVDRFVTPSNQDSPQMREFRSTGFKPDFNDDQSSYNQVRHFAGALSNAYYGALAVWIAPSTVPDNQLIDFATEEALKEANSRERSDEHADRALNGVSIPLGVQLGFGKITRRQLGGLIRKQVCGDP